MDRKVKSKAGGWKQDEKCPNEKFTGLAGRRPECQTVPGTLQMFNSNKIRSTKKALKVISPALVEAMTSLPSPDRL